jgi:hypothetical protein
MARPLRRDRLDDRFTKAAFSALWKLPREALESWLRGLLPTTWIRR